MLNMSYTIQNIAKDINVQNQAKLCNLIACKRASVTLHLGK